MRYEPDLEKIRLKPHIFLKFSYFEVILEKIEFRVPDFF